MMRTMFCHISQSYLYNYTKPPEGVDIICRTSRGFYSWCPGSTSPVGRMLSGHQLGKPSDVLQIISTHEGSCVFIIHPT